MTGAAVAALPAVSYNSQRPSATLLGSRERENREGGTCAANTPNVCVFEFFVILRVVGGSLARDVAPSSSRSRCGRRQKQPNTASVSFS